MRYSFLALIVLFFALIAQPVQGAVPYRADSTTPTPAAPGLGSVPLPPRAVARFGQGLINDVEISPDSSLIAVGGSVGVLVYDAATLKPLWSARGGVRVMKWSPDSALLAADMNGVSVWNGATGRLAYQLKDYSPSDLEWSPDSRRLVMASNGGLGLIWYVKAGTLPIRLSVGECDPTGACIYAMHTALSPDGRLYATSYEWGRGDVGGGGTVQGVVIWDALTGAQEHVLSDWGDELAWLRDSTNLLVSSSHDALLPIEWDTKTGQQVEMTTAPPNLLIPEGTFHLPSGDLVAWNYACADISAPCLVDVKTAVILCNSWLVSPDFKLCMEQNAPDVVIRDIESHTEVRRIEDVSEIVAYSRDWNLLVGWSASSPGDLNVWNVSDGQMIGKLAMRSHPLNSVAWSPDGHLLATVGQDANTVQLLDAVTGQVVQNLPNPAAPSDSPPLIRAAFSPDGTRLAVSAINGTSLVIWDMASGQPVAQANVEGSYGMIWSPDGTEIALLNYQQQVFVVDAATGNVQRVIEATKDTECYDFVDGVGWSPDGKHIAVGSCGEILLYDAATLNKVSTLSYRTQEKLVEAIPYLAYSPDGTSLATVIPLPDRYILAIWDLASGQVRTGRIVSISDELFPLSSLAWSPNGELLAVGFGTVIAEMGGFSLPGGNIAIFSARTAQQVALLQGHTNDVDGISFSPDSKKLASASLDGTVLIWDLTGL